MGKTCLLQNFPINDLNGTDFANANLLSLGGNASALSASLLSIQFFQASAPTSMRLEAESTPTTHPNNVVVDAAVENLNLEANDALREGIRAAQAGDRVKARTALLRASELDPRSESAWLWLASISDYPEELLVFLNNVLDINPLNARANEWMTATKSLLAKTFVQRGIDAADGGQNEFAAQCFDQALEHDQSNTAAWFWLANLSESNEGKLSYLEKVLELDPHNESAREAFHNAKKEINRSLLAEARTAAVAGRKADAHDLLDAFIAENPESEDGWVLRSHLVDGFAEKIAAFEKVLSINPENLTARSGLDSLQAIMSTVDMTAVSSPSIDSSEPDGMENTAFALEQERSVSEIVHDKNPTQELVFPEAAIDMLDRAEVKTESAPAPTTSSESVNWSMNTVAFTFAFPGGDTNSEAVESDIPDTLLSDSFDFAVNESTPSADANDGELIDKVSFVPADGEAFEPAVAAAEVSASPTEDYVVEEVWESQAPIVEQSIPMPVNLDIQPDYVEKTGFETTVVREEQASATNPTDTTCPFCGEPNEGQVFTCGNCLATLTLSDLEMLLANTHAEKTVVRTAVDLLENKRENQELNENELTTLGIGHLNLRNLQTGYQYLSEASHLNPNNVILASQVNSLLIRLDEIKHQEEVHDAMPKGKSILVVDDSATVRKLIAGKLEKCGHEVFCAADGVEAIEQVDSVIPDLILLDITMPRMDGYQVCKVIRSKESTKDVPVVMISGKDGFFDKVRGRMAGTTGYITKPFGPETLMKAVETYLKGEEF